MRGAGGLSGAGRESTRHYYNPVRHCHNRFPALEIRVRGRLMDMKWEHSSRIKGARQQIKFRTALPRGRRLAHLDRREQPPQPLDERLEVPALEHLDQEIAAGRERLGREIERQLG